MLEVTFDPITNRQDWVDQCEVRDEEDELVDLDDATIVFEVYDRDSATTVLSATTDNGQITIDSDGIFSFNFPLDDVRGLFAKTYDVGCTIELNGVTQQFFRGTVPVLDGVVQ